MEISEFQKSIVVESHTLYQLKCSYEERCLAPIVDQFYDKDRMLKRKLLKFTSSFMNKGAVSFRSHLAKDAWKWHKCHNHYHSMETFATYDLIGEFSFSSNYQWTVLCIRKHTHFSIYHRNKLQLQLNCYHRMLVIHISSLDFYLVTITMNTRR